MREIHFIIALSAISLTASLPQIPGTHSDMRIVNRPVVANPAVPNPFPVHDLPQGAGRQDTAPGGSPALPPQGHPSANSPAVPSGPATQRPGSLLAPIPQSGAGAGAGARPTGSQDSRRESSCGLFPSPGECQAAFPRYYFNETTSQCDCYLFGGCDEKPGSYRTLQECNSKCLPDIKEEGPSCELVFIDNFQPFIPSTTTTRRPSGGSRRPPAPVFPTGSDPVSNRPGGPMNGNPAQALPDPPRFPGDASERPAGNPGPLGDRQPIPDAPLFPTDATRKPTIPNPSANTTSNPEGTGEIAPNVPLFPSELTERTTNEGPVNPFANQPVTGGQGVPEVSAYPSGSASSPGAFHEEERNIPKPPLFPTEVANNPADGRPVADPNPWDSGIMTPTGKGSEISVVVPGVTAIGSQSFPSNALPLPPVGILITEGTHPAGVIPFVYFPNDKTHSNEGDEVESDGSDNIYVTY